MAPRLKLRIKICKPVQTPNTDGGFDIDYEVLTTVWSNIRESRQLLNFGAIVRGEQIESDLDTHEFMVRYSSVKSLGKGWATAFDENFNIIEDINPLKSDYFILMNEGSSPYNKGRLFKVNRLKRDDNYKTYIKIRTTEIEERGTGYPS